MTTAVYDRRTEDIARITGLPTEKVAEYAAIDAVKAVGSFLGSDERAKMYRRLFPGQGDKDILVVIEWSGRSENYQMAMLRHDLTRRIFEGQFADLFVSQEAQEWQKVVTTRYRLILES